MTNTQSPTEREKLAAELLRLIEARQIGAIVNYDDAAKPESAMRRVIAANSDIGDFIGENWPVIIEALRTPPTDTPDGELARELEAVPADVSWNKGDHYSHTRYIISSDLRDRILSRLTPSVVAQPTAEQVREAAVNARLAVLNWQKYNDEQADEVVYQAEKMATAINALLAALPKAEDKTTLPDDGLREAIDWFRRNADALKSEVRSAHSGRGNGCTEAMREDDRDFRRDLDNALAALSADARKEQP